MLIMRSQYTLTVIINYFYRNQSKSLLPLMPTAFSLSPLSLSVIESALLIFSASTAMFRAAWL